ncbi:MAG: hypothetical protein M3P08_07930 [Thermoproteota archaeon]|nr:hypothetical protein [Thermoproteota archaeon]
MKHRPDKFGICNNPLPKEPPPPVPCEASFPGWFCAKAPIATVDDNVYIAWNNNDIGHWNVLFVFSTFSKNIMLSAPNKGHVIDQNVQITASGSNIYVTWCILSATQYLAWRM